MGSVQLPALSPGDTISVIAPGMPFDRALFEKSCKIIQGWGLNVSVPKDILGAHPVCANTRIRRFEFLKQALGSESKAIWAARGGYGSLHLLEGLQKMKKPAQAKWIVGFSDITTLHQFFNQEWEWPTLHGYHIDRLAALSDGQLKKIKEILFGIKNELLFKNLKPMNPLAKKSQVIRGEILGGNLMVLQSTLGTRWQLPGKGKILFFEELGERGYRVDRVLTHMELLQLFRGVKALVLGPFVGGNELDGSNRILGVLKEFALRQRFPVFSGIQVGHIPTSLCLPLNTRARLEISGGRAQLCVPTGIFSEKVLSGSRR
jgi:muramoyltetrapeptide carboxypeptidase